VRQISKRSFITPAVKGQITKLRKLHAGNPRNQYLAIRNLFNRSMPREQSKHAARKVLAEQDGGAK